MWHSCVWLHTIFPSFTHTTGMTHFLNTGSTLTAPHWKCYWDTKSGLCVLRKREPNSTNISTNYVQQFPGSLIYTLVSSPKDKCSHPAFSDVSICLADEANNFKSSVFWIFQPDIALTWLIACEERGSKKYVPLWQVKMQNSRPAVGRWLVRISSWNVPVLKDFMLLHK